MIAKKQGHQLYSLSFNYGQKHKKELRHAEKIARFLMVKKHRVLNTSLGKMGGSALTDTLPVPPGLENRSKIPLTYVPARNTLFLSYALAIAEIINAAFIYIGANNIDYSGYPDCRPEYFMAFQHMANLATKRGIEGNPIVIKTPIIHLSKAEIIKKGMDIGAPLHLTWSCYRGNRQACGKCDACLLRLKGFQKVGIKDPIKYENK
jgi:7-cyano-7-deazaguanine synthase